MVPKIIGLAVLLIIGYMMFRPRHRTDTHEEHSGLGEHAKDVSPHAGHGGSNVDRGSRKTGGGCCG